MWDRPFSPWSPQPTCRPHADVTAPSPVTEDRLVGSRVLCGPGPQGRGLGPAPTHPRTPRGLWRHPGHVRVGGRAPGSEGQP